MFDAIRAACAEVARRARWVHLDGDPAAYARTLASAAGSPPVYDREHHFVGEPADTVAYVLTLDAVNFGSGWFPWLHKEPGMSGYFTVASRLKRRFERRGRLSAEALAALTPAAVAELFEQPPGDPRREELMAWFARALNELGTELLARHGGSFTALVEAAGGSASRLLEVLARMSCFRDVARYEELEVPFYKRAQITASDLWLAFEGRGYGRFDDLHELTIFADNLVPHVLRLDGVLRYDAALARRIAAGEPLPPGSAEEVEIRALAVHAVEAMVAALRADGVPATAQALDVALWNRGQAPRYRREPRHRTRTVFY